MEQKQHVRDVTVGKNAHLSAESADRVSQTVERSTVGGDLRQEIKSQQPILRFGKHGEATGKIGVIALVIVAVVFIAYLVAKVLR